MILSWKNLREGDLYLRVSLCGRFEVRRVDVVVGDGYRFEYVVSDMFEGRRRVCESLQAACQQAVDWAASV